MTNFRPVTSRLRWIPGLSANRSCHPIARQSTCLSDNNNVKYLIEIVLIRLYLCPDARTASRRTCPSDWRGRDFDEFFCRTLGGGIELCYSDDSTWADFVAPGCLPVGA